MKSSTLLLIVVSIAVVILIAGLIRIGFIDSTVTVLTMTNSAGMVVAEGNPPPETQKVTSPSPPTVIIPLDGTARAVTLPTMPDDPPGWDARLQDVLTSEKPDQEIAMNLLGMLSQMPPERLLDTTELIAGLMPDEGYTNLAPLLNQPFLNEDILDALMVDLLDRPETIQLPLWLQIASNLAHPRKEEALDYLELQLDAEHGTDWGAWEREIEGYLNDPDADLDFDLEE